jgi:hypothetical protein
MRFAVAFRRRSALLGSAFLVLRRAFCAGGELFSYPRAIHCPTLRASRSTNKSESSVTTDVKIGDL